jgi:hypothetical protein
MEIKVFTTLQTYSQMLKSNREAMAFAWADNRLANERLNSHNINPEFFARHFGVRVIDYALGVIEGENRIGSCPIIHVLLVFFSKKNIALNDLYIICSSLKSTIMTFAAESAIISASFIEEFMLLMDLNFEGVMLDYANYTNTNLQYEKAKPIEYLSLLLHQ